MIYYTDSAESMIKAFILSKLKNEMLANSSEAHYSFFDLSSTSTNADDYELEALLHQFKDKFNINQGWLQSTKGYQLKKLINYALLNSAFDKYNIIFKALEDTFFKSVDFCLQCVSTNGKKLYRLYRDVSRELMQLQGFIRFKKIGDNCLAANIKLKHNILDLLLFKFQNRYPEYKIILISDIGSMSIHNWVLSYVDAKEYIEAMKSDNYDDYWKEYYSSQYIESRKNIKLAAARIPKKYWDWLPEGEILKKEDNQK